MSVFDELRRRHVFRSAAAYLAGAWLLIQLVNEISPLLGWNDTVGRIVLIALGIGFVPAVVFAWVFQWTPDGLRCDSSLDADDAAPRSSTRAFDRGVMVVLALAVALFAFDRFLLAPSREARLVEETALQARADARVESFGDRSIVVLPFEDLSENGDQEYFSDGIAEELINLLAQIPELRVIARTSAFSFKGTDATAAEIGEALNVAHVLEGSIRVAGDQLRITVQLIEAQTEAHLLSRNFTRPRGDIFAIQDEVAAEVVDLLKIELLDPVRVIDETDPETYALHLQGRFLQNRGEYSSAADFYSRAIERDPSYLPARYSLGWTYSYIAQQQPGDPEQRAQWMARSVATMEQAAAVAPDRPEINAWRGLRAADNQDWTTAARYLERALAQRLDLDTLGPTQAVLRALGRHEQATEVSDYLLARDPTCGICHATLVIGLYLARRFEEAVEAASIARTLGVNVPDRMDGFALLFLGRFAEALEIFRPAENGPLDNPRVRMAGIAMALQSLGRQEEFEETFAELERDVVENGGFGLVLAYIHLHIGDVDAAFDALNQVPSFPMSFFDDPRLDKIKDHPRWPELAEKAGIFPEDPREEISLEFTLPS